MRGQASCDLRDRILRVPLELEPRARAVRAHELMHVRVSPHSYEGLESISDVHPRALECAEELRVNSLVSRLGFATMLLTDGSEKTGGRRLAESNSWSEAVCFLLAVLGTGAEREYLSGIRAGNASWLPALRAVRKRALQVVDAASTQELGSTSVEDDLVPAGYRNVTIPIARLVSGAMSAQIPSGSEALRKFRRSLEPGGRRAPTGRFAKLVFADSPLLVRRPRQSGIAASRRSTSGVAMRYPGSLLVDPHRRAFAIRHHRHGGVVVVDQSGSMDIAMTQLASLVALAPNAVIVGYSHHPGEWATTPNAWLLANERGVVQTCPTGNIGNGIDGPILEWAIHSRRGKEPIVWVTDGQVTDSHDHPDEHLSAHCAKLVMSHQIRMVRTLSEATKALGPNRLVNSAKIEDFGRVGRKIREFRDIRA